MQVLVTSLDDDGRPMRTPVAADGSTRAITATSIELRFDRFLLPTSVTRQSLCVRSATTPVASLEGCIDHVFLEPTYDPVRRAATYRLPAGQRLSPGTLYQVTAFSPPVESTSGFRAFDRAPLRANVEVRFTTVDADPEGTSDDVPPSGDLFCCQPACEADDPACRVCPGGESGAATTLQTCAFAGCHGAGSDPAKPAGAAMGLYLAPPGLPGQPYADPIAATAIEHVAHQTQTGEDGDDPDSVGTARFGRSMPIIARRNPGQSYLLYKLLAAPWAYPGGSADAPTPEELERLRASVVVGMPMPPSGAPVPLDDLALLSAWIAAGAETRSCAE
jgi:hypothetical protein